MRKSGFFSLVQQQFHEFFQNVWKFIKKYYLDSVVVVVVSDVDDSTVEDEVIVKLVLKSLLPMSGRLMFEKLGICTSGMQSWPLTSLKRVAHLQTPSCPPFLIKHMCAHLKIRFSETSLFFVIIDGAAVALIYFRF